MAPEGHGQLKFPTFENPRWRTAAILKIENRLYFRNALTDLHKIGMITHFGAPKGMGSYNFQLLQIQDGGRPPS